MFAMLQRHAKPTSKTTGDSMKFQYGSGDRPLDGYTIKRGIGVGGFGEVYFAESDSGKEVALKRIQKNLDVEMRGVRHCLNLRHTNLVGIYDIRFDRDEQGWIVMEFIEGESLRDRMDREPQGLPADQAMALFAQIVAGCTYLHDQGIVHRDLKPANIFIESGLAKIGDYGLSKYISTSRRAGQTESVGTFHYMAPEIGKGEYGKEIDIYSLGIILYEMLTGDVPFDGESTQEIILKHLTADPDLSAVPQPFAAVIERALAKNPVNRFRDGRDMLQALGYEIDAAGLAVRSSSGPVPLSPKVVEEPHVQGAAPKMTYTKGAHGGAHGRKLDMHANLGDRINLFFNVGIQGHAEALKHEPIMQWCVQTVKDFGSWARNARDTKDKNANWWRNLALIAIFVFVLINSTWITPSLIAVGWIYVVYYVVWFLMVGWTHCSVPAPSPAAHPGVRYVKQGAMAAPAAFQETVHFHGDGSSAAQAPGVRPAPAGKPISSKEALRLWQQQQRDAIGRQGMWTRLHSTTRSMTFAGFIAAVATVGGGFLALSNAQLNSNHWLGGIAWLGIMTTLTSWCILALSRAWESRAEDSIVFRFILMAVGLGLGAASFQTSEFLMVPWEKIAGGDNVQIELFNRSINRTWRGFYDANGIPVLAGHMAFFASLLWILRWWRQSDALRRKRFSVWTIVWSMLLAALVQGIFYFPGPWHVLLAGATSFVVQLASPWLGSGPTPRVA